MPFLADDDVIEVSLRRVRGRARCHGPLRRSRPTWPGSSRTSRPTNGWPSTPPCAVDAAGSTAALLAHPLVGQHELAERLTDRLLAGNAQYLAWTR